MFSGIVSQLGTIKSIRKIDNNYSFQIKTKSDFLKQLSLGDSVSINGICLTTTEVKPTYFSVDVMPETQKLTNLKFLKENDVLNLENSLRINEKISGHFVSGHIDSCEKVLSFKEDKDGFILTVFLSPHLRKYITYKGSITINGVSLTVMKVNKESFSVALIPFTLENTNLGQLKKYDTVNIEIDLIARYVESLIIK